jgi:hypothetical protein
VAVLAGVPLAVAEGAAEAIEVACAVAEGGAVAVAVAAAVAAAVTVDVDVDFDVDVDVGVVPVVESDGDLLAGESSLHEVETAAPVMMAAPSAYCAAREMPAGTGSSGRQRTSPSQNGQRVSVRWTCRLQLSQTTNLAIAGPRWHGIMLEGSAIWNARGPRRADHAQAVSRRGS